MLHLAAFFAIFLYRKGGVAVMAGAAGFTFFHIRHGVVSLYLDVEYGIVAGFAVGFNPLLFEMLGMIEYYRAGIRCLESDILDAN